MKKRQLVNKLDEFKDREVMVWNGLVSDVMPIGDVVELSLTRTSLQYLLQCIRNERAIDLKDWNAQLSEEEIAEITKEYKNGNWGWELNDFITQDDIDSGRYVEKKILVIEPKKTGKTCYDRVSNIEY